MIRYLDRGQDIFYNSDYGSASSSHTSSPWSGSQDWRKGPGVWTPFSSTPLSLEPPDLPPSLASPHLPPILASLHLPPSLASPQMPSSLASPQLPSSLASPHLPSSLASPPLPPSLASPPLPPKGRSFGKIGRGSRRGSIEEAMLDFQLNGVHSPYDPRRDSPYDPQGNSPYDPQGDSPYDPQGYSPWTTPLGSGNERSTSTSLRTSGPLSGMGPAGCYLRQKSWPAPDRSPDGPLPRPHTTLATEIDEWADFCSSSAQWNSQGDQTASTSPTQSDVITADQKRVILELPDTVLYGLLRDWQAVHHSHVRKKNKCLPVECRFCKNNNERESYYRSHVLKDAKGRVTCPVLRAFVCSRCGVSGDAAHTIKYCPLSTREERILSENMMRSRSVRRKCNASLVTSMHSQLDNLCMDEPLPSSGERRNYANQPLEPLWAALALLL